MTTTTDRCIRCKKSRSEWLVNKEGYRAYCCWGCADDSGCTCGRKTHRKSTTKEEQPTTRLKSFGSQWSKKRRIKE